MDAGDSGLGYFVFPPSGGSPSGQASTQTPDPKQDASKSASGSSSSPPLPPNPKAGPSSQPQKLTNTDTDPNPWSPDPDHLASLHRARLAREALEAQKGEEYWVSCGGVLRDSNGRRDLERTRKVREELALREKEKKLLETWEEYERRWTSLVKRVRAARKGKKKSTEDGDAMDGVEEEEDHLTFNDIPWPISASFAPPPPPIQDPKRLSSFSFSSTPTAPSSSPYPPPPEHILSQLTPDNIRSFLLETLTVRGTKVTPRERIRSSMLRWHPDKMGRVVERVRDEEERELVVRGVGEVVRALQRLMVEVGKERGA
ncbi:hypothetical protein NMY22_g4136 [Coprinellus aureogranulatus]|nr:hypothetical protein NMY22_g4136 [Coprinellus aureogranulatus]